MSWPAALKLLYGLIQAYWSAAHCSWDVSHFSVAVVSLCAAPVVTKQACTMNIGRLQLNCTMGRSLHRTFGERRDETEESGRDSGGFST